MFRPTLTLDVAGLYLVQLVANDRMAVSLPDSVAISTDNSWQVASRDHAGRRGMTA